MVCVAALVGLLSACASSPTSTAAASGGVKVEYSVFGPKLINNVEPKPTEVLFVDRSQMITSQIFEAFQQDPAIQYGLGLGIGVNAKSDLPGVKFTHLKNRANIKNPIASDYLAHLKGLIDDSLGSNEAFRHRTLKNPFVVRGGHTRLIYEELAGKSDTFRLRMTLDVSKDPEGGPPWQTSEHVNCNAQSVEPLPLDQWAANDYALIRTELDGFLRECDAKVVNHLPIYLAK